MCPRQESNLEPTDYESAALTIELQGHKDVSVKLAFESLLKSAARGNCGEVFSGTNLARSSLLDLFAVNVLPVLMKDQTRDMPLIISDESYLRVNHFVEKFVRGLRE